MKRLLVILAAAGALAAIAAFSGIGRPETASGDVTPPDSVTTVGHGVVTAVPDEAVVNAGVHTQATTAADALAENSRQMNAVIAALKAAGGTDLQTQQVSLYPQSDADGHVQGFVADNSVSAKAKVAGAGALVDAAVGAGANTVSGPTLDVSDADALYRDALGKALADARAKADALAKAGSFAVGAVSSVTEQPAEVPGPVFATASAARDKATPVEPGTQDVTADVSVTFRIH
jgi:hypothetical protein